MAFLICPVLGPIIHRKNWLALGRAREAATSMTWIWIFGLLMVSWQIAVVFIPEAVAAWPLYIVLFAIWYWTLARKQSRLLHEDLVGIYRKRSVIPAALFGIAGTAALILLTNLAVSSVRAPKAHSVNRLVEEVSVQGTINQRSPLADSGKVTVSATPIDGAPSDHWVRGALGTLNRDFTDKPFKRGEILRSLGGAGIPVGTPIYPIQIEEFPLPIYLSKDSFAAWQFTIGDEARVYKAMEPETPEQKQKRQAEERENEKESKARIDAELRERQEEGQRNREKMEADRIAAIERGRKGSSNAPASSPVVGGDTNVRLATAKSELAALETRMETERKRYSDSIAVINKETSNKTRPVQQGSAAYYRCAEASKIIQEVEAKAPEMKAEKARLEELVKSLEAAK